MVSLSHSNLIEGILKKNEPRDIFGLLSENQKRRMQLIWLDFFGGIKEEHSQITEFLIHSRLFLFKHNIIITLSDTYRDKNSVIKNRVCDSIITKEVFAYLVEKNPIIEEDLKRYNIKMLKVEYKSGVTPMKMFMLTSIKGS